MSKQTIWNYLKKNTSLPDVAIAGIMGNMECESNCESMRLQNDFSYNRQMSQHYADMVNSGTMDAQTFQSDQRGWGLCQWTWGPRKANLLKFCQSYGKGIEDEETQLRFMLTELQSEFLTTWKAMLTATTTDYVSDIFCRNYENPEVTPTTYTTRRTASKEIYNKYHSPIDEPVVETPVVDDDYKKAKAIALLEEAIKLLTE